MSGRFISFKEQAVYKKKTHQYLFKHNLIIPSNCILNEVITKKHSINSVPREIAVYI